MIFELLLILLFTTILEKPICSQKNIVNNKLIIAICWWFAVGDLKAVAV